MAGASVEGVSRLSGKLNTIATQTPSIVQTSLLAGAQPVVNAAKRDVPKLTGNLSRSLHAEATGDKEVTVGTDVEYAGYVEMGTSRMQGRPYLRPALAENQKEVVSRVQASYKKLLQSQAG